MSQENVEIVKRCLESWVQRDLLSRAPEVLDPDVEFDLSRNVFNPQVYRGLAGLERLVSGTDDVWDDFRIEPEEVTDDYEGKASNSSVLAGNSRSSSEAGARLARRRRSASAHNVLDGGACQPAREGSGARESMLVS